PDTSNEPSEILNIAPLTSSRISVMESTYSSTGSGSVSTTGSGSGLEISSSTTEASSSCDCGSSSDKIFTQAPNNKNAPNPISTFFCHFFMCFSSPVFWCCLLHLNNNHIKNGRQSLFSKKSAGSPISYKKGAMWPLNLFLSHL